MDPARIVADHLIWESIRAEYAEVAASEPLLAGFLSRMMPNQPNLETTLAYILAAKLDNATPPALSLRNVILDVLRSKKCIQSAIRADLQVVVQRGPAAVGYANSLLYFKGFHPTQVYRVAHSYWEHDRHTLAPYLQSQVSEVFAVDIHSATRIGRGIIFDHATSVVIDEIAVVEGGFSMLHKVTLGGSDKESGDHHPKIGRGVMIGAGAKILGNIRIREDAKIGAGSVVLKDVPPHATVTGIPAKVISVPSVALPALDMDQFLPSAQ